MTFNQVVWGSNPRTLTVKKVAEILMFQGFPLFLMSFLYLLKCQQMCQNMSFLSHQFLTNRKISHQFRAMGIARGLISFPHPTFSSARFFDEEGIEQTLTAKADKLYMSAIPSDFKEQTSCALGTELSSSPS